MQLIITAEKPLVQMYGLDGYRSIRDSLGRLAQLPRWGGAPVVAVDVANECQNLTPGDAPRSLDPIEVNRWLSQVEKVKEEPLDHLLIAGDDLVVPFHRIRPDPTGDDSELLSDNPYASRDLAYLIPDRAVGRIPNTNHSGVATFLGLLESTINQPNVAKLDEAAFGITTQIWRDVSADLLNKLKWGNHLEIAPPTIGFGHIGADTHRLIHYYNLHGSDTLAEYFGDPGFGGCTDSCRCRWGYTEC